MPDKLEWMFSDGTSFSIPRNELDIGNFTFSYRTVPNGSFFYKYTLDNREVEFIRVGELDHSFGKPDFKRLGLIDYRNLARDAFGSVLKGPDGWFGTCALWRPGPEPAVSRSEMSVYTIVSKYLPGALRLHMPGREMLETDYELPFDDTEIANREVGIEIHCCISAYGNSTDQWVIGPAFKPKPTEEEVRHYIHELVQMGMEFLCPIDDGNTSLIDSEALVKPSTDFEVQTLKCLMQAIRAMVPHNPRAADIEKVRLRRKVRRSLGARGVSTTEQAKGRLQSLRSAQSILNIVQTKLSMVPRRPDPFTFPEAEMDARLQLITNSTKFAAKWEMMTKRLLADEPYRQKLINGTQTALTRLNNRIEAIHLAFDLKVSPQLCQKELARSCGLNLERIKAESVFGIHLTDEEARMALVPENWEFVSKYTFGPDICNRLTCRAGNHQLSAEVWTDPTEEAIGLMRLQLSVQLDVLEPDGTQHPKMMGANQLLILSGSSLPGSQVHLPNFPIANF
jgi:hypothetical protein